MERKYWVILVVAVLSFMMGRCSHGCSEDDEVTQKVETEEVAQVIEATQENDETIDRIDSTKTSLNGDPEDVEYVNLQMAVDILSSTKDVKWDKTLEIDDSEVAQPLKTYFKGRRPSVFNDSNHVQLVAAEKLGIEPVTDMASAWNLSRPVVKIASCEEYYLEELTHSIPYLVPEAATLLKDIGARFNKLLWERGESKYRIKVTSVLRTPESIDRLMRRNVNAVEVSAHQYATTFDVSYSKFVKDQEANPRTFGNLCDLLSEVLQDFQSQGRCYVKYEGKQSCFHITVRPK